MRRLVQIGIALITGLFIGVVLISELGISRLLGGGPDPVAVASGSLRAMKEQARLTAFSARFVAVVTSTQQRFGLKAEKTLILPGNVRYELDLAKVGAKDLSWDGKRKVLSVRLPPLELSGPEVDLSQLREYGGGGLLSALTNARPALDASNRNAAREELLHQAREPVPMKLARDAARRAVERAFALPLKAVGVDATVKPVLPEEAGRDDSFVDRSRRVEEVMNEQEAKSR